MSSLWLQGLQGNTGSRGRPPSPDCCFWMDHEPAGKQDASFQSGKQRAPSDWTSKLYLEGRKYLTFYQRQVWEPLLYLFKVSGWLDLPDRLHESVPYDNADICAGVAIRFVRQLPQVAVAQAVRRVAKMKSKHLGSGRLLRKRDVNPLLKSDAKEETFSRMFSSWKEILFSDALKTNLTQNRAAMP